VVTRSRRLALAAVVVVLAAGLTWFLVRVIAAPPAAFRDRAELPSCGRIEAGLGPVAGPGVECFDAALRRGDGAELVVVTNTDEGDPIVSYYRSLPGGAVEVFADASEDTYGSVDWFQQRCPGARSFDGLGSCADVL
jgi:hypothetical protein